MKLPYLVALDEGFPRKELLEQMDRDARFGTWFYSMPNSFVVYSAVDANVIDAFVREKIGEKYRYFITEIALDNRQGWMPRQHWDIIYRKGAEKLFDLNFQGYYTEIDKIPELSGVFCVYRCIFMSRENTVKLNELLYVGMAGNVREGVQRLSIMDQLKADCLESEILCFSFAAVPSFDLEWCFGALSAITDYKHKDLFPRVFHFHDTFIITKGQNFGLKSDMLVECQSESRG